MGTGAPSKSNRRKNPTEERKKRKKAARKASRSSKRRRRHDSPSPSSRSDYSSPPASSSALEDDAIGAVSRGRSSKKDALVGRQRSPSRGGGSSRRQKKAKKASYQGEKDAKRRVSRSKLGKGSHQKKGHDRLRRRHRSSSRSTSVGSPDTYSSRSCSTCRSRSSSPESTRSADRSLRSKGKVVKASSSTRGRSSSRKEKERSGRRPSDGGYRYRSRSCSSFSREGRSRSRSQTRGRRGGSEFRVDEGRLAEKSHFRNLPTTSTLVKHSDKMEHGYGSGQDGYEAEIIQDFDDLHTSRSNDSYESERKRDSGMAPLSPLQQASERRRHDDSSRFMGANGHADKAETALKREISSSVVVTGPHDGAQWGNRNVSPAPRYAEPRLKSQVSTSGGGSEADDLELLLRQKALENFKKFHARNSTNANSVRENKYQSIPIKVHEVTTGKSEAAQVHESGRPITVPAKQKSYTSLEHHTPANDGTQLLQVESISDANVPAQACNLVEKTETNNKKLTQQHPGDSVNIKIAPDSLFSNSEPCSKEFQAELSEEICGEDLSSKNMSAKKNSAKAGDTDIHREEGGRVDVSASTDTSCHRSASEFEQKTMSVVHGGEVVQVSYKVYIPKRTPALARRRLQQ